MTRAYTIYALAILLGWGAAALNGWEPGSTRSGVIPAADRQSGGYRSFSYWHGGK